ncbi:MAG: fimbria/pilus periplasmic chaperone [Pseudomonadales bacterium]
MLRIPFIRLLAVLAVAACAAPVAANMVVDRSIIRFAPGEPVRTDVTVANRDSEPLFVQVEVHEVVHPGSAEEVRVELTPDMQLPLLVSPDKLVLAGGQTKLLRLVNLAGSGDVERIFRVTLRPVPPPAEVKQSGIRLFVAYELLVIVAPQRGTAELRSQRIGNRLIFENQGNTNVMLHSGRQCAEALPGDNDEPTCVAFRGNRVYPGNVWELELPYSTPVEFTVADGDRSSRRAF